MTNEEREEAAVASEPTIAAAPEPDSPSPLATPVLKGELRKGDIRIYLNRAVYDLVGAFANSNTTQELGGVLLGRITGKSDYRQLTISGAIPVKSGMPEEPALSFSPEVWSEIYREKEVQYPDGKIVGWFLTHPGTGISLTNYDISLAKYYFTLPWQVAWVLDPLSETSGFCQWEEEKLVPCTGYYLYESEETIPAISTAALAATGEEPEPVQVRRSERKQPETEGRRHYPIGFSLALNVVLLLAVAFLLVNQGRLKAQYAQRVEELEVLAQEAYGKLAGAYDVSDAKLAGVAEAYSAKDARIAELEAEVARLRGNPGKSGSQSGVTGRATHTVQKGDTLYGISEKYYGDRSRAKDIMVLNGIQNQNLIKIGDVLKLPPK